MGFNKKVLSKAVSELGKAKAPAKPKDIITDPAGQWKYPGQETRIPGSSITMQGVNYPVWAQPNIGPGTMMQPNQDYEFPGADYVDETPMAKKGGTLQSKKYSKSMSATNKFFAENYLFEKPSSRKNKIYDPHAKYYQDGGAQTPEEWEKQIRAVEHTIGAPDQWSIESYKLLQDKLNEYKKWRETTPEGQAVIDSHNEEGEYDIPLPEHLQDYTNAMMKARLAYANEFGNPAAKRMINLPDNPYQFDNGDTGTHYMASMDNYAVPQIQDENGQLMLGDYGPESDEAIRFDSDEDANYFAEHYKDVAPGFINAKLSPKEIQEYAKGGYIIEELPEAQEGGPKDTIIYPPGDSEYMNQPALNYDILEMQNQKARRNYEQYLKDSTDPTNIQRASPSFQQKYFMNKDVVNAKTGGYVQHELVKAQTGLETEPQVAEEGEYAPTVMDEFVVKGEKADWLKLQEQYEKNTPYEEYFHKRKQKYLKSRPKNLTKLMGIGNDDVPESVANSIYNDYQYRKNNYVTKNLGPKKGFNPRKHGEWVDNLSNKEREIISNSRYGKNLQPSLWTRTGAGAQELANFLVKSTGIPALMGDPDKEVLNYKNKGLTNKEYKDIHDSGTGALNIFAAGDIPGAIIANALTNSNREQPGWLSGQLMGNVTPERAAGLNPLMLTGAGEMMAGKSLLGLGVDALRPGLKNIGNLSKYIPERAAVNSTKNTDKLVDLYRIQEKNSKTFAQLAKENKLHPAFNNAETLARKADEEKYFGQWFTKDKNDLDFYKADREFTDPEIINLKVPESKLTNYSNYDKSLSRAPDREFVIPHDEQSQYINASSNAGNLNAGFSPELIQGAIGPKNKVIANIADKSYMPFLNKAMNRISPLNWVPGYGKKLEGAVKPLGNVIGNSIENGKLVESKSLFNKAKGLVKKGEDADLTTKMGKTNASDIYSAKIDGSVDGSKIGLGSANQQGFIGRNFRKGNASYPIQNNWGTGVKQVPLTDAGVSLNRRLPFSNRYVPIDKEKLMTNKFQWATTGAGLQKVGEKFGAAALTTGIGAGAIAGATYDPMSYVKDQDVADQIRLENGNPNDYVDIPTRTDAILKGATDAMGAPSEYLKEGFLPNIIGSTGEVIKRNLKQGGTIEEVWEDELDEHTIALLRKAGYTVEELD